MFARTLAAVALATVGLAIAPADAAPMLTQSFALRTLAAIAESGAPVLREDSGRRVVTSTDQSSTDGFWEASAFAAWTAADRLAESRVQLRGAGRGGVFDPAAISGQAVLSFDASVRNDSPDPVDLSFVLRTVGENAAFQNLDGLLGSTNAIFLRSPFYGGRLLGFDWLFGVDGRFPGPFGDCDFQTCAIPAGQDNLLPVGRLAPGETFTAMIGFRSIVRLLLPEANAIPPAESYAALSFELGFTGVEVVAPPPPPLPAPGALAFLGLGVAALAAARRRTSATG
jgi:hypothetical protein